MAGLPLAIVLFALKVKTSFKFISGGIIALLPAPVFNIETLGVPHEFRPYFTECSFRVQLYQFNYLGRTRKTKKLHYPDLKSQNCRIVKLSLF